MASVEERLLKAEGTIETLVQNWADLTADKKTGDQLAVASSLNSGDKVIILQGTELKIFNADTVLTDVTYVDVFEASHDDTTVVASQAKIKDNGKWKVYLNGISLNATNGVAKFKDTGAISIDFPTGVITFNNALSGGDQIKIEYNV